MTTYGVDRSGSPASAAAAAAGSAGAGAAETFQLQDALLDSISLLADPDADRILFWDDSAGNFAWLTVGTGLDLTGTTLTSTGADHGALTGLADDDHTQYALLAGRSGGQTLAGDTASDGLLTLKGTSHATGGHVVLGGGTSASELRFLEASGSGTNYTALKAQAQAGNVTYTLPAADAAVDGYALKSNAAGTLSWGAAGGENARLAVTQTTHGFAVGDVLYHNGTDYAKADADAEATAEALGIVDTVSGADDFTITFTGSITTLSGLTAGTVYFLSGTAGAFTSTEPSTVGQISKPMLVATSTTAGVVLQMRGAIVGQASSSFAVSRHNGDGSTVAFTMGAAPTSENNTCVFISGIYQQKDTYSTSGTTLTFSTAPPTGTDNIEVVVVGALSIGTPSDSTVTLAKMTPGATLTIAAEQASTSGTAITFTGIPSGTKQIIMMLEGVSVNGTVTPRVVIGDAGGLEETGYIGSSTLFGTAGVSTLVSYTTGLGTVSGNAGNVISAIVILTLKDAANFTWSLEIVGHLATAGTPDFQILGSSVKSLTAELTQVSVVSGTNSFDAGSISIAYA